MLFSSVAFVILLFMIINKYFGSATYSALATVLSPKRLRSTNDSIVCTTSNMISISLDIVL